MLLLETEIRRKNLFRAKLYLSMSSLYMFVVKKVSFKIIFTLLWFMKVIRNGELHYKLVLIA